MRLLLVELTRFRSRRAVVLSVLGAAVLIGFVVWTVVQNTRPPAPEDLSAAERAVAQEQAVLAEERERCLADPEALRGPGATAADCVYPEPEVSWYLGTTELALDAVLQGDALAVTFLLLGVSVVLGSTFAGADWASGSMSNQLLFRPRRGLVWLAKALAVGLGTAVAATVLLALFWGALYAVAGARGLAVPDATTVQVLGFSGRAVALAGAAALGSFALVMLFRHTVGALGLLLVYAVAGQALVETLPVERAGRFGLAENLLAWLKDGTEVYDEGVCSAVAEPGCDPFYTVSLEHAAVLLGALLAVAVVASFASFRRRDIP